MMTRREFLINAYKFGGLVALWSLGVCRLEASNLLGSGIVVSASSDGFVGLDGVPGGNTAKATNGADSVSWSGTYVVGAGNAGTIGYIHVYFSSGSTNTYNVGIYNSDGTTKLGDCSLLAISAGYTTFQLDSPIVVTVGQTVRFQLGQATGSAGNNVGYTTTTDKTWEYNIIGTVTDTMPNTANGSGSTFSNFLLNIYADNTP